MEEEDFSSDTSDEDYLPDGNADGNLYAVHGAIVAVNDAAISTPKH